MKIKINAYKKLLLVVVLFIASLAWYNLSFAAPSDSGNPTGETVDFCKDRQSPCSSGFHCNPINGACIENTAGGTTNPADPEPVATQGKCGDGFESINGVCVPQSEFGSGSIAQTKTWEALVLLVLKILLTLAGVVAVVAIVLGGFWYMASGGNEETAEKGRKMLINAIIGLVIVILAYVIVTVITNLLTKATPT